jgi:hypothetical protein
LLMVCRYVWVARKPESATTADYDSHDLEKDGEMLEPGDSEEEKTSADDGAKAARVASPSVLVEPTADLTLNSPPALGTAQASQLPPQSLLTDPNESRGSAQDTESVPNPLSQSANNPTNTHPRTAESLSRTAPVPDQSVIASIEDQEAQRNAKKEEKTTAAVETAEPRVHRGMPAFSGGFPGAS